MQFIGARCLRTDPQTIPGDSVGYGISFQSLLYPTPEELVDFSFAAGVNPFTIINDGIYVISSGIALHGSTLGSYRDTRIIIDGLPVSPPHGNFDAKAPNGSFHTAHNLYTEVPLVAGYMVGVEVFQNSGVDLTVDIFPDSPWLTLRRVR